MSIIKLPIRYEGSQGEKVLYTLFDSGAPFSCINARDVEGIEKLVRLRKPKIVATASEGHFMEIKHAVRLDFYLNDIELSDEFMVVPDLSEEAILGVTTLQKWRIKLDFEHDSVIIDPKIAKFILKEMK
jgi:predicted aspartyl protease